jgi:hypothetical protein
VRTTEKGGEGRESEGGDSDSEILAGLRTKEKERRRRRKRKRIADWQRKLKFN